MNAAQQQIVTPTMARQPTSQLQVAAHIALGVCLLLAVILGGRRVALGKDEPLGLATTLATAAVLLLVAIAARRVTAGHLYRWLPTMVLACWAVACSLPGTQWWAWLLWPAVIATDLWVERRLGGAHAQAAAEPALDVHTQSLPTANVPVANVLVADETPELEEGHVVLQHIVRTCDPEGRQYVHATLRGELEAGQRRTTLHLGFCPPFAAVPQVEAEVMEGPAGVAKVVQTLHHGVQVEVELDDASLEPVVVTVEVAAYEVAE